MFETVKKEFIGGIRKCLVVRVTGSEYTACETAASNRWSNKKKGVWGKGIINTDEDPHKAERVGILGEVALSKLISVPADLEYREKGDKQDFVYKNKKIDVKTNFYLNSKQVGYIKCALFNKNTYTATKVLFSHFDKDIFVFSFLDKEDRKNKEAVICFIGFIFRSDLCMKYIEPGHYKSNHLNFEIPYCETREMSEFLDNLSFVSDTYGNIEESDMFSWLSNRGFL